MSLDSTAGRTPDPSEFDGPGPSRSAALDEGRVTAYPTGLASSLVKEFGDRVGAALLLLLLAPFMLALAVVIRIQGGPVLDRRTCIGRDGAPFEMLTFRSLAENPRAIGTITDRHGLDGLPQLLNVLGGSMSLVGPRPMQPDETAIHRALPVKPGLLVCEYVAAGAEH